MEAIVLGIVRHSDKASVLRAYTRAHGRVNYMVYGRRKQAGQFAPLSVVELIASGKEDTIYTDSIRTLKESSLIYVPQRLQNDIMRQSVAMFIAEVLSSLLVHPLGDEAMFDFLLATIRDLDTTDDVANVHLRFLRSLCVQLGIAIDAGEHPELLCEVHTRVERQRMLQALCFYIEQQIDGFRSPKSLDVLTELFD